MEETKTVQTVSTNEKNIVKIQKNKWRKRIVFSFLIFAFITLFVIYRGEYLETLELGQQYLSVFWKKFQYTMITFAGNFTILFFLIYAVNKRIQKGLKPFFEEEKKQMPKMLNKSISFILAMLISFFTTKWLLSSFLLCVNATSFGITDPVLNYDIGFFLLQQPFIELVVTDILYLVIGLAVYSGLYYVLAFNFYFDGINRETLKNGIIPKQLCRYFMLIAILVATLIFVKTQNVGIQKFLTLSDINGYALYGAGATEVTIYLWAYRILSAVVIISVWLMLHYFKKNDTKKTLASLMIVPAYYVVMLVVVFSYNTFWVKPNELDTQKKYIQNNIQYTKQAYDIDIDETTIQNNEAITNETLKNNQKTIENIAIVDQDTVLKNLNVLQTHKGYYTYRTTKLLSYFSNGKEKLAYFSPREIGIKNSTYNNKTYEYTHGYGAIITSATNVDENGNLVELQKSFGNTTNELITIQEPRIYFGLETNDIAVINHHKKQEFDYPIVNTSKAENELNSYEGQAGLQLNFFDRLILGMKKGNLKIAFSGNVNHESTILMNRNILQRAKLLMPQLIYEEKPYMVVTEEGQLVWVIDAYTVSNYYPYSQRTVLQKNNLLAKTELNYIRNSVKVLVNAYDGTTQFYITDRNDPIIMAYQKIYPDLFVKKEEAIPADIQRQFIYPQFLYQIQSEILEKYHNVQADVLYRGNDIWDVATHSSGKILSKIGTDITPYYTMVKTIDRQEATLGLVLPFTPYQKQNLISYLVGTYENGEPKLSIYQYSQDSNVLGPMQIDTQLEQDERISSEIQALNVTGTRITKNMLIVPINNALLYVEPIYQQYMNEENATPVLKKVVVASGNKVAIGNTITEALKNLVSQEAVDIEIENTETIDDLIRAIIKANTNLTQSSENSNWEMFGKDMTRLQELIQELEKVMKEEQKKETTTNTLVNEAENNIAQNQEKN